MCKSIVTALNRVRSTALYLVPVLLLGTLAVPSAAMAEPPVRTFAELLEGSHPDAGQRVIVTVKLHRSAGYQQITAKLIEVTADTLFVELDDDFAGITTDLNVQYAGDPGFVGPFSRPAWGVIEIPEDRVARIAGVDSRLTGTLIGAAIGAAPMALIGGSYCVNEDCDEAGVTGLILAGAGIGAGIGYLVDAGKEREGTVYFDDAPGGSEALTLHAVPLVSRRQKGMLFVVRW